MLGEHLSRGAAPFGCYLSFDWFWFSLEENISYRYKFKTLAVTFLAFTELPPDTPEQLSFVLCLPSFPHRLLCADAPAVVTVR